MFGELVGYVGMGVSIFVKTALIFLSCISLFVCFSKLSSRKFVFFIAFTFFLFFIYFIRLCYDWAFQFDSLGLEVDGSWYVMTYITMTVAPVFSFLIIVRYYDRHVFFNVVTVLSIIAAFSALVLFRNYISNEVEGFGPRLSTVKTNPISLGAFFVTSAIITWCYLLDGSIDNIKKYLCSFLLFFYFILVILSGSRGALASLIGVVVTYLIFCSESKKRFIFMIVISCLLSLSLSMIISLSHLLFGDIDFFRGYLNVGASDDLSAMIRIGAYENAISQFVQNPIFGDLSLERVTRFYPHNVFIDILMSLGIMGGVVYAIYIALVFYMSIKVMRLKGIGIIVSLLWLQQFYGLLFSSSIFQTYFFWAYSISLGAIYLNPILKKQMCQEIFK